MREAIKVLFITQEITPFLPESEIATLCRYLPQAVQDRGNEIRAFMPKFVTINERRNQLHEVQRLSGMNIIIDDTDHPLIIKVASLQAARMQVYFIDNEDYFHRRNILADENGIEYKDNGERTIFFARGVLETIKKLRWTPDVIHCHGWMTALVPLYIKHAYSDDPCFRNAKMVYSIYNDEFNTPFQKNYGEILRIDGVKEEYLSAIKNNPIDFNAVTKLAIDFSDAVIQGSQTIQENLVNYITLKTNRPFLPYQAPDNYTDAYIELYKSIL
ncbi:glycogen/starch synthase [Microbacter margulisiae]|uniref:starch synthase n=1 Tax=Microbacter margulisiae TaxID=1350067 RepID=A0A7W5H1F4_9PORP|nr:glycogen/starch synthase [Microbacter margulisiae]MBB3187533.1 starch synthase [Microbacter margulisiae]